MNKLFGFLNMVLLMAFCSCKPVEKPQTSIGQKSEPQIVEVKKKMTELDYYADLIAKYKFENYPNEECKIIKKPAKPDVSKWRKYPKLVQEIKEKYSKDNPDFDCKYKVVTTYCGSPCQVQIIFNSITGKPVEIIDSANGVEYGLNSSLFVVNPPDENILDTTNFRSVIGPPVYWQMRNGKLHKLE